jgi:EmrB/QacA subfamily drug resistance transporter
LSRLGGLTAATGQKRTYSPWATLVVLCLSLLIISIDNGILNVALPTLIRELGATPSQVQWMVDSYLVVFGGLLLTSGRLADRYGRKRVLTAGLALFGVSSFAASFSTSPGEVILWRAGMGIGAALIMPATLSILVNVFTDSAERSRAIAYWSLMNATGAFFGPVLGGLLLRRFWWGSIFLVNVPVVVVALVLGRFRIPESRDPDVTPFDIPGAVLSIAAMVCLLWGIIEGPAQGWGQAQVVAGFVGALVLGAGFVVRELTAQHPMVDLSAFASPQLSAAAVAMMIAFMAMVGTMFLVTQSLQLVKGYTPLAAALATSGPIVVINFLVMPRAPGMIARFGTRWLVAGGTACIAVASVVISLTSVDSGYLNLFFGFAIMALGFSSFVPASTEAIVTAVPVEKAGGASAVNQLCRQLGQSLGVAIGGSIAASGYRASFARTSGSLPPPVAHSASSSITAALDTAEHLGPALANQLLAIADAAFLTGVRVAVLCAGALAVLATVFAAIAIPGRVRDHERS